MFLTHGAFVLLQMNRSTELCATSPTGHSTDQRALVGLSPGTSTPFSAPTWSSASLNSATRTTTAWSRTSGTTSQRNGVWKLRSLQQPEDSEPQLEDPSGGRGLDTWGGQVLPHGGDSWEERGVCAGRHRISSPEGFQWAWFGLGVPWLEREPGHWQTTVHLACSG